MRRAAEGPVPAGSEGAGQGVPSVLPISAGRWLRQVSSGTTRSGAIHFVRHLARYTGKEEKIILEQQSLST
jgi:hypothetical protein